ncbi:MAG: hypothetical protein PHF11_04860 [Candidatus Omnitrophica bacterium]|nr:hypothetical protein [Candidatus Omnitrophota bacterium]
MMEYSLLTAVAIICLLAVGYLNKIGGPGGVFERHFNKAAQFIGEGG